MAVASVAFVMLLLISLALTATPAIAESLS
jgi:hypothetical protein